MPTKSKHKVAKRKTQGAQRRATAGPREHLRRLVDELPEAEVSTAARFLRYLRDGGVAQEIEDRLDVELAREALEEMERTGEKPIPLAKVKQRLGR